MIYLDHAATTACAPEVVEAMLPHFRGSFANAASVDHRPGNDARIAVETAREAVAALVGAKPEDVVFTSGATEANNLALSLSSRVLTTRLEHPSILDTFLARRNDVDSFIATDSRGLVDLNALSAQLADGVETLVSVIATNNETGVEQDIESLTRLVSKAKSMLHIDGTQAVGTRSFQLDRDAGLVAISLSAHKIRGPKGVGALVGSPAYRRRIKAVQLGGGHERGLRSGTLNVPAIVGFGVAAAITESDRLKNRAHLARLRSVFVEHLAEQLGHVVRETIEGASISPHIASLRFENTNARALLRSLRDEVAFSLGSACATNKAEPSHVLIGLGLDKRTISQTVRFSFSTEQTVETVNAAATQVVNTVRDLADYSLTA